MSCSGSNSLKLLVTFNVAPCGTCGDSQHVHICHLHQLHQLLMSLCYALQAAAADYFAYSSHLASWGIAVLQYDFNLLASAGSSFLHTDAAEVSLGWVYTMSDWLTASEAGGMRLTSTITAQQCGCA